MSGDYGKALEAAWCSLFQALPAAISSVAEKAREGDMQAIQNLLVLLNVYNQNMAAQEETSPPVERKKPKPKTKGVVVDINEYRRRKQH
ncbi:MAG TPA: hypothetical protein GXX50_06935 [Firmicutes bacterium]|nr:hypothetical protein [Bacillota bacterium]